MNTFININDELIRISDVVRVVKYESDYIKEWSVGIEFTEHNRENIHFGFEEERDSYFDSLLETLNN